MLEEDDNNKKLGVWILCNREGKVQEATFFFTGVLTNHSMMPFATNKEYILTFLSLVGQKF